MAYIDEKGKKFKYDYKDLKHLDQGDCANIFYDNKIIFKIYDEDLPLKYKIQPDIFNVLKEINNPHFIKLYDLYMHVNLLERFLYLIHSINFMVDCYTAKYYKKEKLDPMFMDKEYLLNSLYEIEKIFNELAINKIKVSDIKKNNTVYTNDSIVIIDPDFFRFSTESQEDIKKWNKRNIITLFESILLSPSEITLDERDKLRKWYIDNPLIRKVYNANNATDEIAKKLQYVKRPIDIIRK